MDKPHKNKMLFLHLCGYILHLCLFLLLSTRCGKAQDSSTIQTIEKKSAVVTLLTTKEYVPGAEVLAQSLIKTNTAGDRVLLYISNEEDERSGITEEHLRDLKFAGWDVFVPLTKKDGNLVTYEITEEVRMLLDEQGISAYDHVGKLTQSCTITILI